MHSLIGFLLRHLSPRAASLLIILFAAGVDGSAESALSGRVSDEAGGPLPGVTVSVHKSSGDRYDQSVQTNGQGQYNFRELPNGEYLVGAELRGFVSVSL